MYTAKGNGNDKINKYIIEVLNTNLNNLHNKIETEMTCRFVAQFCKNCSHVKQKIRKSFLSRVEFSSRSHVSLEIVLQYFKKYIGEKNTCSVLLSRRHTVCKRLDAYVCVRAAH